MSAALLPAHDVVTFVVTRGAAVPHARIVGDAETFVVMTPDAWADLRRLGAEIGVRDDLVYLDNIRPRLAGPLRDRMARASREHARRALEEARPQ